MSLIIRFTESLWMLGQKPIHTTPAEWRFGGQVHTGFLLNPRSIFGEGPLLFWVRCGARAVASMSQAPHLIDKNDPPLLAGEGGRGVREISRSNKPILKSERLLFVR